MSVILNKSISSQNSNGLWDLDANLSPGTYIVKLNGTDLSGNPITESLTFTIGASSGGIGSGNSNLPTSNLEVNFLSVGISLMILAIVLKIISDSFTKLEVDLESRLSR